MTITTTAEQTYAALFDQLANPLGGSPERLAETFRALEEMHAAGQITEWQLQNASEAYARTGASRVGHAAHWALDKAKDGLQSAAEHVGQRTSAAVVTYTQRDPVRAVLIAAATGAVVMSLVSMMARSGARKVRRTFSR